MAKFLQMRSFNFQIVPSSGSLRRKSHLISFSQRLSPGKFKLVFNCKIKHKRIHSVRCFSETKDAELQKVDYEEKVERPPFDINLAVILAGFAFEAYTSPPVKFHLFLLFMVLLL